MIVSPHILFFPKMLRGGQTKAEVILEILSAIQ
jgi:hypothetical protein